MGSPEPPERRGGERRVDETDRAFDVIARSHFGIEDAEVFACAVLRGAHAWAADWRALDRQGVLTCLEAFRFGRQITLEEFERDMVASELFGEVKG